MNVNYGASPRYAMSFMKLRATDYTGMDVVEAFGRPDVLQCTSNGELSVTSVRDILDLSDAMNRVNDEVKRKRLNGAVELVREKYGIQLDIDKIKRTPCMGNRTQSVVAEVFGTSVGQVKHILNLRNLTDSVRKQAKEREVKRSVLFALSSLPPYLQDALARYAPDVTLKQIQMCKSLTPAEVQIGTVDRIVQSVPKGVGGVKKGQSTRNARSINCSTAEKFKNVLSSIAASDVSVGGNRCFTASLNVEIGQTPVLKISGKSQNAAGHSFSELLDVVKVLPDNTKILVDGNSDFIIEQIYDESGKITVDLKKKS